MLHGLLSLFIALAGLFHSPSYTEVIDKVQSSVVRITGEMTRMTDDGVERGRYSCTGEVIASHRVLTAAHCVGSKMWADGKDVVVLKVDKVYDLALLGVDTSKPALVIRDAAVQRFEPLSGIGYAYGWNRLTVLAVKPFMIDFSPPDSDLSTGMFVQGAYIGGMSGGPVVDAKGLMVGMVQRSDDGVGYGVGVVLIKAFLLGV